MIIIYMVKEDLIMNELIKNIFRKKIYIDTSAWFSLMHQENKNHNNISFIYNSLLKNNNIIVTSNFVIGETYTLMRVKLEKSSNKPFDFLDLIKKSTKIKIVYINKEIEEKAIEILKKYTNHKFSYVDATSFALMKDRNIEYALTLDKHYATAGFMIVNS